MNTQTHKIAAYKTKWGGTSFVDFKFKETYERDSDYVQLTEFIDVEFPELPQKEVLDAQLAQLNKAEAEARAKFQAVLNDFERRRQELLALPHFEVEV